ncbi:penicillin-binding protein 2 [Jeotgalibacillus marinus]|uniref:Penicillin-binding protein 2 n=2 Tax=Jeotgalibacillus marinus TaxID=86667 RepID=A0ABV3PZ99_9BACL
MNKNAVRSKKEKKSKKNHVSSRMNVLFFAIFLLFSSLILRLGFVQIVDGETHAREVERTEEVVVNTSIPRGKIFDRNGNIVVDNEPVNAIIYTRTQQDTPEDMVDLAEKLADLITMDTEKLRDRDKQDFWRLLNEDLAQEKITDEEKEDLKGELEEEEYDDEIRDRIRERITEEELNTLDLETLAIYSEMQKGSNLSPQMIKNENVTDEEIAKVDERLDSLPGVNTMVDWKRDYRYEGVFKSALGKVGSIPEEQIDAYLSKGYSRDDRVGTSFLELQYEPILQGQKSKDKTITDKAGNVIDQETIAEGERGNDLVLSIDMELQAEVEEIVEGYLWDLKTGSGSGSRPLLDRAFVVMMDPKTGEVLSMVGKQYVNEENGPEILDYTIGAFTDAYEAGSSVKGATVLSGYQDEIIKVGGSLYDEPIKIAETPEKSSWFYPGESPKMYTDLKALEKSSNGFMFKIAIDMAGATYEREKPIDIPTSAFNKMRNYFGQFGLGVETQIDLPRESIGVQTNDVDRLIPGKLLDLSIGQFDTYTTMQLAQYVSTIANGGYRIAPTIVKEIREPSKDKDTLGPLLQDMKPEVLNKVDNTKEEIDHVKQGFYDVFHGSDGTGSRNFRDKDYVAAGKTGTAEAVIVKDGNVYEVINSSAVGYAPASQPEVAFSVLVPAAYMDEASQSGRDDAGQNIGELVVDKYFELREKRMNEDEAADVEEDAGN